VRPGPLPDRGERRAAAEAHRVEIQGAKLHYRERTDEIYYVIVGQGTMVLGGEEVELHEGVVVYVARGARHQAQGEPQQRSEALFAQVFADLLPCLQAAAGLRAGQTDGEDCVHGTQTGLLQPFFDCNSP
jgi:hypothetical protein